MKLAPRPGHVPQDRVFDFDLINDVAAGGLHDALTGLHDRAPDVFWTPRQRGQWVATRMADVIEIMTHPDIYSSYRAIPPLPWFMPELRLPPQDMDAPEHLRYRLILLKFLAPREVKKLEGNIRSLVDRLIDEVLAKGSTEFVADVSVPLPVKIFMGMMGMDLARHAEFVGWANALLSSQKPFDALVPFFRIHRYMKSLIKARKRERRDDVISLILDSRVNDEQLSDKRVLQICTLLFLAGLDTVTNGLGFIIRHLATHPEHQQRLRDNPAEIPAAIEELLRRYAFVSVPRRVTRDTVLNGAQLKAEEIVIASLPAASNDDRVFEDPLTVDFDRPRPPHVAFNIGPHNCAGASLARLEIRILLEQWLLRVPPFRLVPGQHMPVRGGSILAIEEMRLAW